MLVPLITFWVINEPTVPTGLVRAVARSRPPPPPQKKRKEKKKEPLI